MKYKFILCREIQKLSSRNAHLDRPLINTSQPFPIVSNRFDLFAIIIRQRMLQVGLDLFGSFRCDSMEEILFALVQLLQDVSDES